MELSRVVASESTGEDESEVRVVEGLLELVLPPCCCCLSSADSEAGADATRSDTERVCVGPAGSLLVIDHEAEDVCEVEDNPRGDSDMAI